MFLALDLDDGNALRHALAALAPATALQGSRPSAVGLGTFNGSDVLIAKRPGSHGPVDLATASRGAPSEKLLLCAEDGLEGFLEERTPPIRYRGWLFGGGSAAPAAAHSPRERALDRLPEYLRRQIPGRGSLDLAFLSFLVELQAAGLLGNPAPEAHEALPAFAAAARRSRDAEGDAMPPLVALSRRCLLAARGAAPLWQQRFEGVPGAEKLRLLAITDAPVDPGEWTEIPKGALLSVDRGLEPQLSRWVQ
ncbi:MAG: hypothetical protein ACYDCL_07910 [Myxococcales bacterium]